MRDLARAGMLPTERRAEFAAQPSITVNCGASGDSGGGFLPAFENATDQYLAEGAKPFFIIPLWAWVLVAGGAAWWFWGRHHVPNAPTWLGGKG